MHKEGFIKREASDKAKGFRLQKIRVIELILDAIEDGKMINVLGAVEFYEDVALELTTKKEQSTTYEENKNYDKTSAFTVNSHEVLNTFVSFVDLWFFKYNCDPLTKFVFYSTNTIGKEKHSTFSKKASLALPSTAILSQFEKGILDSDSFTFLKESIKAEYEKQYERKNTAAINRVNSLTDTQWKEFFGQVCLKFEADADLKLKETVLEKIKKSCLFTPQLEGKEDLIFSDIMEKIDERQNHPQVSAKFVHKSDIENSYFRVAAGKGRSRRDDYVWQQWEQIPEPENRNIEEKIKSVSKKYSPKAINVKNLVATRGMLLFKELKNDKPFLSLRYRVYECCIKLLYDKSFNAPIKEAALNKYIIELVEETEQELIKLESSYNYDGMITREVIEGTVHALFDECFLAFD